MAQPRISNPPPGSQKQRKNMYDAALLCQLLVRGRGLFAFGIPGLGNKFLELRTDVRARSHGLGLQNAVGIDGEEVRNGGDTIGSLQGSIFIAVLRPGHI